MYDGIDNENIIADITDITLRKLFARAYTYLPISLDSQATDWLPQKNQSEIYRSDSPWFHYLLEEILPNARSRKLSHNMGFSFKNIFHLSSIFT